MKFTGRITSSLTVIFILLLITSIAFLFKLFLHPTYLDFQWNYTAIKALTHGANPYTIANYAFDYPPPALFVFLPFTALGLQIAGQIFIVLSLGCIFLSLVLLLRFFHTPLRSPLCLFLTILVLNFFPLKWTLGNGQINAFILLLVVLVIIFYSQKRYYLSGIILACAIAIKFFPLILLPYFVITKRWELLTAAILTLFMIYILVFLTIPYATIMSYFWVYPNILMHAGGGTYYFDQSISAFLARTLPNHVLALQISHILSTGILIGTFIVIWLQRKVNDNELLSISMLLNLDIIFAPFAWQHYFIWLLIPFLVTFFYVLKNHLNYRYYIILGLSYLLVALNIKNPAVAPIVIQSHVFYGAMLLYGLDLYFILKKSDSLKHNSKKSKQHS